MGETTDEHSLIISLVSLKLFTTVFQQIHATSAKNAEQLVDTATEYRDLIGILSAFSYLYLQLTIAGCFVSEWQSPKLAVFQDFLAQFTRSFTNDWGQFLWLL